jgi:sensor c-di-GMP phosphodiesterase-like protein
MDALKLDLSFVRHLVDGLDDSVVIRAIISMANSLKHRVIAEGVETEAQRVYLEQFGCTLCQGYLFSKAVPVEEFEALLCTE